MAGMAAPPGPLIPVPPHLQKSPIDGKFLLAPNPRRLTTKDYVQVDHVRYSWSYAWNPDHGMTTIAAECWKRKEELVAWGLPMTETSNTAVLQTPRLELHLRDTRTGMCNTLRWHAAEALNYLGGMLASIQAEWNKTKSDLESKTKSDLENKTKSDLESKTKSDLESKPKTEKETGEHGKTNGAGTQGQDKTKMVNSTTNGESAATTGASTTFVAGAGASSPK